MKRNVAIFIKQESKSKWKVIGGVIAAAVCSLVIGIVIVSIIVIRNRHLEHSSDMFVDLDTFENQDSSVTFNNVLRDMEIDDDPFAEDFEDQNHFHHGFHNDKYHHID